MKIGNRLKNGNSMSTGIQIQYPCNIRHKQTVTSKLFDLKRGQIDPALDSKISRFIRRTLRGLDASEIDYRRK